MSVYFIYQYQPVSLFLDHRVCRFSLYPRMPPRRQKRPSVHLPVQTPPKRTRRVTKTTGKDKVQRVPAATAESPTTGLHPSAASSIPPGLLEQIVSKVTTEVTKQLTPLLIPAGQSAPPSSQLQEEVPACTPTDVTIASGDSQSSHSVAAVVSDSVNAVNATLSGEVLPATTSTPLPSGPLFNSASLPIDSRVSPKLKGKIWLQEYIDFGSLLVNPVLDNKFQLSLQTTTEGRTPSLCFEPAARPKKIQNIECLPYFCGHLCPEISK